MALGRLNVFISGLDEPCKIDSRDWFVTIYDCDGRVFEWCGRRYVVLRAHCGHLEVELPPGCYTLVAVWGFWTDPAGNIFGNHLTDHGIAQVCCDRTTCVTLYTPTAHRCGQLFKVALRVLEKRPEGGPPAELVAQATEAIDEIMKYLPRPARPFELGHLDELLGVVLEGLPEDPDEKEEGKKKRN
jgi:hypothetical protein